MPNHNIMKPFFQNSEFQLDEILFENRNRQYGAYALRSASDQILMKSTFMGISLFAVLAVVPFAVNTFSHREPVETEYYDPFVIRDIEQPPVEVRVKPPAKQPVNTVDSRVPTPAQNPAAEKVMPAQTSDNSAVPGVQDIEGTPPAAVFTPPAVPVAPTQIPTVTTDASADSSPKTVVDVEASFAGGIDGFRSKFIRNFDGSALDSGGETLQTVVVFIVEKDGTISEVKATGPDKTFNRMAEETVKSVKGKWIPAKIKGENVRSYFKFPVSMRFE